jgi:hypothetical protein
MLSFAEKREEHRFRVLGRTYGTKKGKWLGAGENG